MSYRELNINEYGRDHQPLCGPPSPSFQSLYSSTARACHWAIVEDDGLTAGLNDTPQTHHVVKGKLVYNHASLPAVYRATGIEPGKVGHRSALLSVGQPYRLNGVELVHGVDPNNLLADQLEEAEVSKPPSLGTVYGSSLSKFRG